MSAVALQDKKSGLAIQLAAAWTRDLVKSRGQAANQFRFEKLTLRIPLSP